jgi:hypothetical protein
VQGKCNGGDVRAQKTGQGFDLPCPVWGYAFVIIASAYGLGELYHPIKASEP